MPYRYLEEVAIADVAFEAEAESPAELFEACALATFEAMAELDTVPPRLECRIALAGVDLEGLLYDWLSELIYLKDREALLFSRFLVSLTAGARWELEATAWGDRIDPGRMALRADAKAVTYHRFRVWEEGGHWRATVVLDI